MSKRFLRKDLLRITLTAVTSFFIFTGLTACGEEEEVHPQMQAPVVAPKPQPIVQVSEFTTPKSSEVTVEKAKLYAKASGALVELGYRWSDRIEKAPVDEKIMILNAYNVARDQLCARIGLAGIAEYNWITTVALPDPKNKKAFEDAGVRTAN